MPKSCMSIWGPARPARAAELATCPNCKSFASVAETEGSHAEVQVTCPVCGMVAIDGAIVVKGIDI